jgi:hypothetical protein
MTPTPTQSAAHVAEKYSATRRRIGPDENLLSLNGAYSMDDCIDLNRWFILRTMGLRIVDLHNQIADLQAELANLKGAQ